MTETRPPTVDRSSDRRWHGLLWTGLLVLVPGLYLSVAATVSSLDIARSAFFAIRAPAEPVLGIVYSMLAVLPWVAAALVGRAVGRRAELRPFRFIAAGGTLIALGFVVLVSTVRIV